MLKRLLILLFLYPVSDAQERIYPDADRYVITVFVCKPYRETEECRRKLADWQRLKDESDLNSALIDDFRDARAGKVSLSTRKKIIGLSKRLAKNNYQ